MKTDNKRDIERTRSRIIHAAAVEFAEHGLKGARVDAIAKRAGANKAMIYYIFGGKEKLHLAVLQDIFESKTTSVDKNISDPSLTAEELLSIIETYFDTLMSVKEYARIVLDDLSSGAKALRRLKKEQPQLFSIFEKISDKIKAFTKQGVLKPIDPDKSLMMLIMVMVSFTCMQSHMDLAVENGTDAHKNLSDHQQWKHFLVDAFSRIFFI